MTGILPFKQNLFTDEFASASVTDWPMDLPVPSENEQASKSQPTGDEPNELSPLQMPNRQHSNDGSSPAVCDDPYVSPAMVLPMPQAKEAEDRWQKKGIQ